MHTPVQSAPADSPVRPHTVQRLDINPLYGSTPSPASRPTPQQWDTPPRVNVTEQSYITNHHQQFSPISIMQWSFPAGDGYDLWQPQGGLYGGMSGTAMGGALGRMGGGSRGMMLFRGEPSGRLALQFLKAIKLKGSEYIDAVGISPHKRRTLADVNEFLRSFIDADGGAYVWGLRALDQLADRYRCFLHRYVKAAANANTYANRLQDVAQRISHEDLQTQDGEPAVSLHDLLHASLVQFLLDDPTARLERIPGGQVGVTNVPQQQVLAPAPAVVAAPSEPPAPQVPAALVQQRPTARQMANAVRFDTLALTRMPPYARPADQPALAALGDEQPPAMPASPQLPAIDVHSFERTVAGIQAFEADALRAGTRGTVPTYLEYVLEGSFRAEFIRPSADELAALESMQPTERDDPRSLAQRLRGLVEVAGPLNAPSQYRVVTTYMEALRAYSGGLQAKVYNALDAQGVEVRTATLEQVESFATRVWGNMLSRNNGQPPTVNRQTVAGQRGRGGAGAGGLAGRGGYGMQGQARQQQPQGSYGRQQPRQQSGSAHAALEWYDTTDTTDHAYAAQQTELPPITYHTVPPPTHFLQQHQALQRTNCRTCGQRHNGACWIEDPGAAPAWWPGPGSPDHYITYVRKCKQLQKQPVRYLYDTTKPWPADVAAWLKQVGTRAPARRAPPTGQASGQHGRQEAQGPAGYQRQQRRQQPGRAAATTAEDDAHMGLGYMAEDTASGYAAAAEQPHGHVPSLDATFVAGGQLDEEEEEEVDPADTTWWSISFADCPSDDDVAEALITAHQGPMPALRSALPRRQQPKRAATAGRAGLIKELLEGEQPPADPVEPQEGVSVGTSTGRPPLPPPVVAGRRPTGSPAAAGSATQQSPAPAVPALATSRPLAAATTTNTPASAAGAAAAQPAATSAAGAEPPGQQWPAERPGGRPQPLPFPVIPIPAGTPPAQYPAPILRQQGKGNPVLQAAVARGGAMQMAACVTLRELAKSMSGDAFKQLLLHGNKQMVILQRSLVAGAQLTIDDIAVSFESMADAVRAPVAQQAFSADAALAVGQELKAQAPGGAPAAELAAAPQVPDEGSAGLADMGGPATSTTANPSGLAAAAEGCGTATEQHKESAGGYGGPAVNGRPSTYELPVATKGVLGLTVRVVEQVGNKVQPVRVLAGLQRCIVDTGANKLLMGEECARKAGLHVVPTDRRIKTSNGQLSGTLGKVTECIQYVLCEGTDAEAAVVFDTYVVPGSGDMYDLLLGTPLLREWGLFIDPLTSMATYRPSWHTNRDGSKVAQLPAITIQEAAAGVASAIKSEGGEVGRRAGGAQGDGKGREPSGNKGAGGAGKAVLPKVLGDKGQPGAAVAAEHKAAQPAATAQPAAAAATYQPPTSFCIFSARSS